MLRLETPSRKGLPIRSGRRVGDGFGFAWVLISGRVDDATVVGIARAVLPTLTGTAVVWRRTRRKVLITRDEG